ncbi:DUF4238 domain-containing protein [Arthrobacter sp. S2(2024)]|uniref:DUF4238 domain-containing protein n=1 Tax=Arthrobacter sp. S2(2024) TaxID=3111911 RepID=UPI002FC9FAB8
MSGLPKHHHIPAALIGGFGEPSRSEATRDARVAVLDKRSGKIFTEKAENVGWRRGLYSLHFLPAHQRDVIDSLWTSYEPFLPKAVAALAKRRPSEEDLDALRLHIACAAVRIPGFPDLLKNWHPAQGSEITDDQARALRLEWIDRGRQMDEWFWRALHAPSDVNAPFVLSDTGYAKFPESQDSDRALVFLPLSPTVGLLGSKTQPNSRPGLADLDHRGTTITSTSFLGTAPAFVDSGS